MAKATAFQCAGYTASGAACTEVMLVGEFRVEATIFHWTGRETRQSYCCFEHASRHFAMLDCKANPGKARQHLSVTP